MTLDAKALRLILAGLFGLFFIGEGVYALIIEYQQQQHNQIATAILGSLLYFGLGLLIIYSQLRYERNALKQLPGKLPLGTQDLGGKLLGTVGTILVGAGHLGLGTSLLYLLYAIFGNYSAGDVSGIPLGVALIVVPLSYFLGYTFKESATP